ncbi:MAG: HAD family hydrolase [Pseudomonadota bacterium]
MDRDGAINEDREDYVKSWDEFRFIRGAKQALKQFNQAGVLIVVITNQSVIGQGLVTEDELFVIHERMTMAVEKARGLIQKIYYCLHHPDERCRCRKLRIGLLEKAGKEMGLDLKESVFVGDSFKDIQAGKRAGCRTLQVQTGRGKETIKKILSGKTSILYS